MMGKRINIVALSVFSGFFLALLYHYILIRYFRVGYPWNGYLFYPEDRFNDLFHSINFAMSTDLYSRTSTMAPNYFPFTYLFFHHVFVFSREVNALIFISSSILLYFTGSLLFFRCYFSSGIQEGKNRIIAYLVCFSIILFSYPLHFALDRGNLDTWIGGLCLIYVALQNTRYRYIGSLFLGIATAFKGYPAAFFLLDLADRRYGQVMISLIFAFASNLAGLLFFDGGILHNFQGFASATNVFIKGYVFGDHGMHFCSDPFSGIHLLIWMYRVPVNIETFFADYSIAIKILVVIFVAYTLFVPSNPARRITAATLIVLYFPSITNDYKLVVLFLPVFYFIKEENALEFRDKLVMFCLILLLVPKHYYYYPVAYYASISCLINPVLLITITIAILADPGAWKAGIRQFPSKMKWYLQPFISSRSDKT